MEWVTNFIAKVLNILRQHIKRDPSLFQSLFPIQKKLRDFVNHSELPGEFSNLARNMSVRSIVKLDSSSSDA